MPLHKTRQHGRDGGDAVAIAYRRDRTAPGIACCDGEVKGLRARGGYTVDIQWENGMLKEANIKAMKSGLYTITYQGRTSSVEFNEGEHKTITC